MGLVNLSKGYVALVDDCDLERVDEFRWYASVNRNGSVYARKHETQNGKYVKVYLHRFILGISNPKVHIDHRNGDGLDCRRANIRVATPSQNMANRAKRIGTKSKYRGIRWIERTGKWNAAICVNGKRKHLGYFFSEIDAARAYDAAAIAAFGEFAHVNIG